jgi:thermitase
MKKFLLLAIIATPALSAEYIVKYSNESALKSFPTARPLNLKSANFALVESSDKSFLSNVKSIEGIEYAELNHTYEALASDADFSKQWGLNNTGRNSGGLFSRGVAGMDIGALEAWKITKGSSDIKIAVIDTGVDYNHVDLKNNIMINEGEIPGNGIDDDGNGYVDDVYGYNFASNNNNPMDGHGHGTHCAGVIGAEHNNIGIAGVMANVKILPIKFLSDSGSGTLEGALKSVDYAITRGVHIMSNSWGGGARSEALLELIQKAEDAGIIFIAAAGNSRSDNDKKPTYPANYEVDSLVSVGAIDGKGKRASFSNYGAETVHVFAPGVNTYSTVQGNKYKNMSGTSMACPHVAGVAGLILSQEPGLTPLELKARMMQTSRGSDDLRGSTASGYVRADKALQN